MEIIYVKEALSRSLNQSVSAAVKMLHWGKVETYNNNEKERGYFTATVADESGYANLRIYALKTMTDFVLDNNLMLQNILRKYRKEQLWFVSSSRSCSWAPVPVPESTLAASTSTSSSDPNTPIKLSEAVSATNTFSIQGKAVQVAMFFVSFQFT